MSSDRDPYYYSDPNPVFYENDSESPVTRRLSPPGQSWPQSTSTSDQSGYSYSQPPQSSDPVGNSLETHDVQDTNYFFDYDLSFPLPSTSSQGPGVGTDTTYINDNIPFLPFANLPFYPYPEPNYELSQHQHGYTPYYSDYDSPAQPLLYGTHQHPAQNIPTSQTSQGHFAPVDSYTSSTQLLSLNHGGPVSNPRAAPPAANSWTPEEADTGRTSAGQHSHLSPVDTSPSNQTSAGGPSRLLPSSPERKRLLPWSADDEHSTARRVVPRHDRAWSVHSTSSDSPRRSRSNSDVLGRGPLVPQERYTTSTISSYKASDSHPPITFNLENPEQIGIPITDILDKTGGFTRLRDRTQAFDMEKKTFTLRVRWPGYQPWSKTIAAQDWTKSRAPITRVKLADAVATAIRGLFERYCDKPYDPDYAKWNVGPNGIQLDQVCLVALHHVSKGSWQPELCLLGPRR